MGYIDYGIPAFDQAAKRRKIHLFQTLKMSITGKSAEVTVAGASASDKGDDDRLVEPFEKTEQPSLLRTLFFPSRDSTNPDAIATLRSVFDDPLLAKY